ncbi:MAG: tRNA 2-thiouridine(34) synthase MnmA [Candidatus Sericytochromatia bacterium]|nr:tRNA 2-thiouridine(34) synthase MnmA [Candidatus Sericytochromatia bacterium]
MAERVAVAMSGGVDSSVAASLLVAESRVCVGISMVIWPESRCCNTEAMKDAAEVAASLGVPFHRFDFVETFKRKVVDHFTSSYLSGLTPNPCAICNSDFKFLELFDMAQQRFGCDRVATGHYARVRQDPSSGRWQLLRAVDLNKDQTYMLYGLTQDQLARCVFPVGALSKAQVRAHARALGFVVADKPESQDLCFSDDPQAFLREQAGDRIRSGDIVDLEGRVLGRHAGVVNFTIGQRRGLGISASTPLYVVRIDAERALVVVGPKEATLGTTLMVEAVNWLSMAPASGPFEAEVKIRYRSEPARAVVEPADGGRLLVRFFEAQPAITPGQVAVFYDGELVLAGGLIARDTPVAGPTPAAHAAT